MLGMSFYYRIIYGVLFLLITKPAFSQEVQWASKILGYSSEYRPGQYGQAFRAKQILGEPSKLPDFGNSPCAWSPAEANGKNEEWIKVGFDKPISLKQVAIAENYNPGAVYKVFAYTESGKEHLLFDESAAPLTVRGRMMRVFPKQEGIMANAIKIVLQPSRVSGFNQIDAIGISSRINRTLCRVQISLTLAQ